MEVSIVLGSLGLGLIVGFIFSLLYLSCDAAWKKVLSFLFSATPGGYGILSIYKEMGITDYKNAFFALSIFSIAFLCVVVVMIVIACRNLKSPDLKHQIGLTDILLGNAKSFDEHRKERMKQLDDDLNINNLNAKLEKVKNLQAQLESETKQLERKERDLRKLGNDKLRISLPIDSYFFVTEDFLELMPHHIEALSICLRGLTADAEGFSKTIKDTRNVTREDLRAFLVSVSLHIAESLFGKDSSDVRIHFRCYRYDKSDSGYEQLLAVTGGKLSTKELTFIPDRQDNMISQSASENRALLKSHNPKHDFRAKNYQRWEDYLTYTFPYKDQDGKHILSFGLSVKSATKYRSLLEFLNFCKFEYFLLDVLDIVGENVIKKCLYPNNN